MHDWTMQVLGKNKLNDKLILTPKAKKKSMEEVWRISNVFSWWMHVHIHITQKIDKAFQTKKTSILIFQIKISLIPKKFNLKWVVLLQIQITASLLVNFLSFIFVWWSQHSRRCMNFWLDFKVRVRGWLQFALGVRVTAYWSSGRV